MRARYLGKNGEHLGGIPARDLAEEDWAALDGDQRKLVRASTIYEVQSEKAETPSSGAKKED
jgi:hypothetical protein